MKILYLANIRLPTEKAHGIQIMEMCSAFVQAGADVTLVISNRSTPITDDVFAYYGVERTFHVVRIPVIDTVRFGRAGFLFETVLFSLGALAYAVTHPTDIIFCRDELVLEPISFFKKNIVWESHDGRLNRVAKKLLRAARKVIVTTASMRDTYLAAGGRPVDVFLARNGVDISRFNIAITQAEARKQLGLPLDKKIALYKGHLYERKGAYTFARAARDLREKNVLCVFIGGTEQDVESFKKEFGEQENVLILGNRPRSETPLYQKAADLLIIPNSAKDDISKLYTSPMKIFGYMASDVPIIASDLPSLREIIDDSLAYFFTPDDPRSLSEVILKALGHYEEAKKKSQAALILVEQYSWQKRAQNILDFIKTNSDV